MHLQRQERQQSHLTHTPRRSIPGTESFSGLTCSARLATPGTLKSATTVVDVPREMPYRMRLRVELDGSLGDLADHEEGGHGGGLGVCATTAAYSSRIEPREQDLSDKCITLRRMHHDARSEEGVGIY